MKSGKILASLFIVASMLFSVFFTIPDTFRNAASPDFKSVYLAARLYNKGLNPYQLRAADAEWFMLARTQGLKTDSWEPVPFVYPPIAIVMYQPLIGVDLHSAITANLVLNLAALVVVFLVIGSLGAFKSRTDWLLLLAIFFAWRSIPQGLATGNPGFVSLALATTSWYCYRKNRVFLSVLLVCLASFKPNIALPFMLFYLIGPNRWFFVAGFILTALINIYLLFPYGFMGVLKEVAGTANPGQIMDYSLLNPGYPQFTNIQTLIYWLVTNRNVVLVIMVWLFFGAFLFVNKYKWLLQKSDYLPVLLVYFGMVLTYHRHYDSLAFLLVFSLVKPEKVLKKSGLGLLVAIPFIFPVTGLFLRWEGHIPTWLYTAGLMNIHLGSLAFLGLFLWEVYKKSPIKQEP
jgi:Glycosyltransferase family 87